jgi:hypothetical protein
VKVRLAPAGLAILVVLVAFNVYLKPTSTKLAAVQNRLALDEAQSATITARQSIQPRIEAERHAIAMRLHGLQPLEAPVAEAHLLTDLMVLAKRSGVTLSAFAAKGTAVALAPPATPTPAPMSSPAPGASVAPTPVPAEIVAAVPGLRLPRSVTVSGRLSGILWFLDGLGQFPELVRVSGVSLAQNEQLRATVDFDLLVIDQAKLREALRV